MYSARTLSRRNQSRTPAYQMSPSCFTQPDTADFKHRPLDHEQNSIRYVEVLPDLCTEGFLQCQISHHVLPTAIPEDEDEDQPYFPECAEDSDTEAGPYMCLSYVWGDSHHQTRIRVNDKIHHVRKNLWDFLSYARRTLFSTPLWIDALCIDQNNTAERNHQVQQMGRIYSGATTVLIWLGMDQGVESVLRSVNSATNQAIAEVNSSLPQPSRIWNSSSLVDNDMSGSASTTPRIAIEGDVLSPKIAVEGESLAGVLGETRVNQILLDSTGKAEKLFEALSKNEYWARAWVTQEVLLAKHSMV